MTIIQSIRRVFDTFHSERAFKSLMKSQWLRPLEMKKLYEKRLRALLKHSYESVPYYRQIFREHRKTWSDINSAKDLQKLPILTRRNIRDNLNELISTGFPRKNLILSSTGGSTGEPLKYMHDRVSLRWINAAVLRSFHWAGFRRFDRLVNVWGFPVKKTSRKQPWNRQMTISVFGADEKGLRAHLKAIKKFRPKGIRGYASSLYLLARLARDIHLSYAISSSEMLLRHYRDLIEDRFGCNVYDNYSSREFMIASECEEHIGYHIASENLILETVQNDEHVSGDAGKILITDLTRYGMPLIRYEIGDIGVLSDEVCPCGRGLPLLKTIEGRRTDMVFTPDGKFISGPAITLLFKDLDIVEFQLVQRTKSNLTVRIVKGVKYREDLDTEFMLNTLKQYMGDMSVQVEFVDEIAPTMSGKRRVVVSMVNKPAKTDVA